MCPQPHLPHAAQMEDIGEAQEALVELAETLKSES